MNRLILTIIVTLINVCILQSAPTDLRPVTARWSISAGSASIADTYLSPTVYDGWHTSIDYRRYQAMRINPHHLTQTLGGKIEVNHVDNPTGTNTLWDANLHLHYGVLYRWRILTPGLTVGIGPAIGGRVGVTYNPRGGNNPAAAHAALTLDARALARYAFTIGKLPLAIDYTPTLPLTGAFFAPQYGQLYYEIYLGQRSHLAHAAWPGNYFALDGTLAAHITLGATTLSLGYSHSSLNTYANHITTRRTTHAITIGISADYISLSPRKNTYKTICPLD